MNKIKYVIIAALGIVMGYLLYIRVHLRTIQSITERRLRDYHDIRVMEKFVECIQNNRDIGRFFKDNQYHTIGIYGMGIVGSLLYRELERRNIPVEFGVDISNNAGRNGCRLLKESDGWPQVDVIVVTNDFYFDKYYKKLAQRNLRNIISIVDVLYGVNQ